MTVIKSKKFILRQYGKGDEKDLVDYLNDKSVSKYLSSAPYPYRMKHAKDWVRKCARADRRKNKK